ncbi:MAG: hypothetical protein HQ555_08650 [Candidatus Aminicenantes bacterium]|nr:hypothetical protein [Candidatus Aminicenantes bacterium]
MDSERHALGVGKILCHLISLELGLRFCIGIKTERSTVTPKVDALKKEKLHPRTAIIDGNSLTEVIQIFNKKFKELNESVDENKIVQLRNALVHGKVISEVEPFPKPMTIFNLRRLKENPDQVEVVFIEEMNIDWFEINIEFLKEETLRIANFYNRLKEDFRKSSREEK